MRYCNLIRIVTFLVVEIGCNSLDNGLGRTPPMGWLAWERFACNIDCSNDPYNCISEGLFMEMADLLVSGGFRDAGYVYVNIDDCWAAKERDSSGRLQADPVRFPSGIEALANYMHARGLKLGIYADNGSQTCGGYPGTLGHIKIDAETFAEWGVDSLKLDGCHASPEIYETGYPNMSRALNSTGRHILFSCSWPAYSKNPNYTLLADICNMWRNYRDISDNWDSVVGIISFYADNQDDFQPFAGPGHWNDPDMLIIGDFGLSLEEQQVQMALWAIFSAPLLLSNDLRRLSEESKAILLNKDVLAVSQDPMGIQGRHIRSYGGEGPAMTGRYHIFSKPMEGDSVAVAVLNTHSFGYPSNVSFTLAEVGYSTPQAIAMDLFSHKYLGIFYLEGWVLVNPSGVRLLHLIPVK